MTEYLEFDSNSEEFVARVKANEQKLYKVARNGMIHLQEGWVNRMKTEHFTGYYPGRTKGFKLRTRSGALKKSAGGRVLGKNLGTLRAILRIGGARAGYAATQEYGIPRQAPVDAEWMRIPLGKPGGKALTPAGRLRAKAVPRPTGESTKNGYPIYESGYGRTFIIEKGGKLFIVARQRWKPRGRFKGNVLLFILKRTVKIPKRLRAAKAVAAVAGQGLDDIQAKFTTILRMGKP